MRRPPLPSTASRRRVPMTEQLTEQLPWHAAEPEEVAARVGTDLARGLGRDDVAERLAEHGRNELADDPPTSPLVVFLRQFTSPLIYILLAAAVVTTLLQEYLDSAVIAAVLVLNAAIGFSQERKAESAVRSLMSLVVPHARVVRGGAEEEIDSRDLVPGDLVLLDPGSRVPADVRLVSTISLRVDESLLTGESVPVGKHARPVDAHASLADRADMAYSGAVVTSGRGRGVVVATGDGTQLGAIAGMIRTEEDLETPLQQRMTRFAHLIGVFVAASSLIVFASGVALGGDVQEMFLTAVALAVAAIPEGLPVVFTITLAIGVRRMARRHAIIRRLPAVETLGSTTVIGSDKTGTLTENRMTVRTIWTHAGRLELAGSDPESGFRRAGGSGETELVTVEPGADDALARTIIAGVLANEAVTTKDDDERGVLGDPTEVALLIAAMGLGVDPAAVRERWPVVAEIPFESERRYAAAVSEIDGEHQVFVKGAPERVLAMCSHVATPEGLIEIDPAAVREAAHELAAEGLRVLAMASGTVPADVADGDEIDDPDGLVLCGMQGMLDPPREGVLESIATCSRAGITVMMITGDHAVTARAIARDLGIVADDADDAEVLTGADLDDMDDEALSEAVRRVRVFARVAPEEKLRIVHALRDNDHVVAVTGDGVNDAPALKAAAIGIAMGKDGTDVAREASDMVLTDDNFVSIAAAVEEGRITFENVRKVTFFLVSTGAASIFAIAAAVWLQWPLLMLPAQLLWLNLVTKGLQDVSLAFEPGEEGVLDQPPRLVGEGIMSRRLWERTVFSGLVMAVGTLVLFRWQLDRPGIDPDTALVLAQTTALTTMVVFGALHVGNSRSESRSLFRLDPLSNPLLLGATGLALTIHVLALYLPPTQFVLRVEPLDLATWVRVLLVATTIVMAMEIDKAVRRVRERKADGPHAQ